MLISDFASIRVLHVVTIMERSGLESRIMDIYRNIDRSKIQFDFLTHRLEDGDYDDEIKSLGGKVFHIPNISPWSLLSYWKNLLRFFKRHPGYKIVHVHLNSYSAFVQYAAKLTGVPVRITHSRNNGIDRNWKMPFKAMAKLLVNGPTTHKFACSYQAGEWLFGKRGICLPNYFKVIPNGFNIRKFSYNPDSRKMARTELLLNDDQIAFVNIGRLSPPKNHHYLLQIFKSILNRMPNAKLFLMGEGELRTNIEATVNAEGMNGSVVFMGNRPNPEYYLQGMDAMIFPSIYEGFGTVALEAQCSGLPTLASDILPKETCVTKYIDFLPITISPSIWADKVIEMVRTLPRRDCTEEVRNAGYDIEDTYKILSEFYISVLRNQ